MMEIKFHSKWFEKCIRDYLDIWDRAITDEDIRVIKYLYVTTTHSYEIGFGQGDLPENFEFSDCGDEWEFCCLDDTAKYKHFEDFIEIDDCDEEIYLSLKRDLRDLLEEKGESDNVDKVSMKKFEIEVKKSMKKFESSVKKYMAEDADFDGLVMDEDTDDYGILSPDDFAYLTELEVVRLVSCETEIHNLKFLSALPKLRVLEVGEVFLDTLEGLEALIGLEKLCVWFN